MAATQPDKVDTTLFGPGMQGKSVFMVVGDEDNVTPAATMFKPVVNAYSRDTKIRLQSHIYFWRPLLLLEPPCAHQASVRLAATRLSLAGAASLLLKIAFLPARCYR